MQLIATRDEKEVWYQELSRPYGLRVPFPGELYVCILFVHDPAVTQEEQAKLSEQIVQSGCRYAVCAGHACSTWDDSVDLAYLATDPNFAPPEETFVMTTWHEDESIEDVVFYGLMNTMFDDHEFFKYLVLTLGHHATFREELDAAIDSVWSGHTKV
jgi:hypothetical protein